MSERRTLRYQPRRAEGTNPRATGRNPRARATNPRAVADVAPEAPDFELPAGVEEGTPEAWKAGVEAARAALERTRAGPA